jgi:hypothetical protein
MRMLDYIGLEVSLIIRLPALVEDLHNPLFFPDLASWCAGDHYGICPGYRRDLTLFRTSSLETSLPGIAAGNS